MIVAESLGLMFRRHESIGVVTPSYSSQSSDDEGSTQVKKKVYLKSRLCNDSEIIGMVRRLSFDPNRDINMPLKYIELPQLPETQEV